MLLIADAKVIAENRSTFNAKQQKRSNGDCVEKQPGIHYARV
jgi:hypothetical protein